MCLFLSAYDLPEKEIKILNEVADEYDLDGDARTLLFVIRLVENGGEGREMGVLHKRAINTTFRNQCQWAAGTISKRYNGNLKQFADRWCPPQAHELNLNWYPNAKYWMNKQQGESRGVVDQRPPRSEDIAAQTLQK